MNSIHAQGAASEHQGLRLCRMLGLHWHLTGFLHEIIVEGQCLDLCGERTLRRPYSGAGKRGRALQHQIQAGVPLEGSLDVLGERLSALLPSRSWCAVGCAHKICLHEVACGTLASRAQLQQVSVAAAGEVAALQQSYRSRRSSQGNFASHKCCQGINADLPGNPYTIPQRINQPRKWHKYGFAGLTGGHGAAGWHAWHDWSLYLLSGCALDSQRVCHMCLGVFGAPVLMTWQRAGHGILPCLAFRL